ncbi:hypothetical protein B7463_g7892, partial [Scytalidium lignicola]
MAPLQLEFEVADPAASFTAINTVDIQEDAASDGSTMTDLSQLSLGNENPVTPSKKGKKAVKKEGVTNGDDKMATPTSKTKRTPKGKATGKAKVKVEGNNTPDPATPGGEGVATSGKRRGSKAVDGETPTKKVRKPAAVKDKLPESQAEFSEGDRLLIAMKKENKPWPEIQDAWTNVTGIVPGKDVLRKRYAKLLAVAQDWKEGDAQKLAIAKQQVEETLTATFKKMEREKWADIAKVMIAAGADEYKPAAVEKKWDTLVKQKLVDAAGNYAGADAYAVNGGNSMAVDVKHDPEDEEGDMGDSMSS